MGPGALTDLVGASAGRRQHTEDFLMFHRSEPTKIWDMTKNFASRSSNFNSNGDTVMSHGGPGIWDMTVGSDAEEARGTPHSGNLASHCTLSSNYQGRQHNRV